ncbi:MAG: hypothetical protein WBF81_02900 [Thermoplasmata archaeon]
MSERDPRFAGYAGVMGSPALALAGKIATGETNLQLTEPLLWVMLAISVAGAIVTFAFLVYAVWKFRDPRMKGRRHG